MSDNEKKLLSDFEQARRQVSRLDGVKGQSAEHEYSLLYDKLAMIGSGNRRRLRRKYRP